MNVSADGRADYLKQSRAPRHSTARDTAFAKIRARVLGTELASRELA
jgi:hypothetical protein